MKTLANVFLEANLRQKTTASSINTLHFHLRTCHNESRGENFQQISASLEQKAQNCNLKAQITEQKAQNSEQKAQLFEFIG